MASKNNEGNGNAYRDQTEPQGHHDLSYTQNRELSWLRFDNRVLDEARDESVPLFERLKFVSIFESNLDEFFMIRVGGLSDLATLKHQPVDNKSGLTPAEQIDRVFQALPPLAEKAASTFHALESQLAELGVERLEPADLIGEDRVFVETHFQRYVLPVISPLVIDPRHPLPNPRNGELYLVCALTGNDEDGLIGLIEVPKSLPRIVEVPSPAGTYRYILLEDVIMACLERCFGAYEPSERAVIRTVRNADIDPDGEGVEEEEDYRQHMKRILKKRLRLQPVYLAIRGELSRGTQKFIRKALGLPSRAVTVTDMPLDLGYVFGVEGRLPEALKTELLFSPFNPQASPMFEPGRSMREQVLEGDKLLFYPYESMGTLLDLVNEAAHDDECISLRITLYRVAKQSRLCESLISAAEHGKEVTVLMELRARFDEENNIEWAERLEEAGCTVIYGSEGFKCHSKICQLTYRTGMALMRITLLGTGNFNEKTAKLYSDFMLMTAHPGIGEDANAFFRNLSLGNLRGDYRYLGVAPTGLKPLIMAGLDREIERARDGAPARALFKMNSLTDREVIDKIAEASQAGVQIQMIIRGISCLRPGVPGKTDNVRIRSIVGRFLEHARVYAFGQHADTVYLSSADMMTRNTEHRVEIAYPVLDEALRGQVLGYMDAQLRDNVKARELDSDGCWQPVPRSEGEEAFNSQEYLLKRAYERAAEAARDHTREATARPTVTDIEDERGAAAGASDPAVDDAIHDDADGDGASAHEDELPHADESADASDELLDDSDGSDDKGDDVASTGEEGVACDEAASNSAAPLLARPEAPETRVQATLIEPDETSAGSKDAARQSDDAAASPVAPAESDEADELERAVRTLATRPRGHVSLGFSLIALGIRTIFGRGGKA